MAADIVSVKSLSCHTFPPGVLAPSAAAYTQGSARRKNLQFLTSPTGTACKGDPRNEYRPQDPVEKCYAELSKHGGWVTMSVPVQLREQAAESTG